MHNFDDLAFRRSLAPLADCLASRMMPNDGVPFVVAIDGPGCCGKSTLTELLLDRLDAVSIGTDDFHEHEGFHREPDAPLPYRRWTDLRNAVGSLSRGGAATIQPINWSDRSLGMPTTIEPRPVLIVDGIGSLHADISRHADLKLWVDGHAGNRMRRTAHREGRDMTEEWAPYVRLEQEYFAAWRPWRQADVFVLGAELGWGNVRESFSHLIDSGSPAV
jgi:uridine kinase